MVHGKPLEVSRPRSVDGRRPLSRRLRARAAAARQPADPAASTSSRRRSPRARSPRPGRRRRRSPTIAGLGPFVLAEHVSGQRLVFQRNPHYFRRDAAGVQLPYLDKLTLVVSADQNAEALRLQAGEIDLMANGDIRAQDYAPFKRLRRRRPPPPARRRRRASILTCSGSTSPRAAGDAATHAGSPASEFRQAVSSAVDRQAIVNTVYLGAAVPIFGPSARQRDVVCGAMPPDRDRDLARARSLLSAAGLADRNGDGHARDAAGSRCGFRSSPRPDHVRGAPWRPPCRSSSSQSGSRVDVVALGRQVHVRPLQTGDYEAIYYGLQASATDPALNRGLLAQLRRLATSGTRPEEPATDWERRIDELMREQAQAPELARAAAAVRRGPAHHARRAAGDLLRRSAGHASRRRRGW